MDSVLESLCDELDLLADAVEAASEEDETLKARFGWTYPALGRHELADMPKILAVQIRKANIKDLPDYLRDALSGAPEKIKSLQQETMQKIFDGGASPFAVLSFFSTINWIQSVLCPYLGWFYMEEGKLPFRLVERIQDVQKEIDECMVSKVDFLASIQEINEARSAADYLPTDLIIIRDGVMKINKSVSAAEDLHSKILKIEENVKKTLAEISESRATAEKLVEKCEEAYSITTTKGLAAAFEQRAGRLTISMQLWVAGLLISLIVGVSLGVSRFNALIDVVLKGSLGWEGVVVHVVLSFLSVGGPLWFAWLATKQIGQRFRIAEDYAFKASVAKAYEGYRKQAVSIDKNFEARLFNSALERLEEPPLRLMDKEWHNSPWHELMKSNEKVWCELIASKAFQNAMEKIPELPEKLFLVFQSVMTKKGEGRNEEE